MQDCKNVKPLLLCPFLYCHIWKHLPIKYDLLLINSAKNYYGINHCLTYKNGWSSNCITAANLCCWWFCNICWKCQYNVTVLKVTLKATDKKIKVCDTESARKTQSLKWMKTLQRHLHLPWYWLGIKGKYSRLSSWRMERTFSVALWKVYLTCNSTNEEFQ